MLLIVNRFATAFNRSETVNTRTSRLARFIEGEKEGDQKPRRRTRENNFVTRTDHFYGKGNEPHHGLNVIIIIIIYLTQP